MHSVTSFSANLQSLILENVSDIIITTDLHFFVRSWNHIAEKIYGIKEADAIGKRMNDLVAFTYSNTSERQAARELQTAKIWTGEVSYTNRKGETFYLLQIVKFIQDEEGESTGILAVGRDITARKRAEEQLRQSEKFYRSLIADSLDITLLLNNEGEITFATPSVKSLLGYDAEEVLQTNAFQYIHPEDLAWAMESFYREVEENPTIKFIVVRVLKKNGEWLWCMARGHNLIANPDINSIVIFLHDDTPRKKVTAALQESEKRFRSLIRDLYVGVVLHDAEGKVVMTNQAMCRMFDLPEEAVLGQKITELFDDVIHEDGALFLYNERPSVKAMATGKIVKDVAMGVWNKIKKERIWIMLSCDPIFDDNGQLIHVISTFTDITERKKTEKKSFAEKIAHQQQVTQATIDGQELERLEIGKDLHDNIGQQLTTVKLLLDLAKGTPDKATADLVEMALKGISSIINDVRSISRALVPSTLKDLGFIDSVNDLIDSLRHLQAITIELDYFDFDEDLLPDNLKLALFRMIQEQLNNIMKHANATMVFIRLRSASKQIILHVKDNGSGFDLAKIRKGIGLSNIINRAELFGGTVEIVTRPGNGCEIKVQIPHSVMTGVLD